jgi:signal transduction histidine kinase
MKTVDWWSVAVIGTSVVVGGIVLFSVPTVGEFLYIAIAIAVFVTAWFTLGRRREPSSPNTIAFVLVTIAFVGAVTFLIPSLAFVQCLVFPLVWICLRGVAPAVVASAAVAASVGLGLYLATGANEDAFVYALVIEGTSVVFTIALGLWITTISVQSDERRRLLDELQAAQAELAVLSRDAGVTSERERLAREIHDTIAQDLTGLVLLAQRASRELAAGSVEQAASQLDALEDNARTALAETRALVASSAPPGLDDGIGSALSRLGSRFERETGISTTVMADDAAAVPRDTEVVLLRCAQEGLANVRNHSGAQTASIRLDNAAAATTLTVADDGCGFDPSLPSPGFGLAGMRDRLALVGGSLDISSSAKGTLVTVMVPA